MPERLTFTDTLTEDVSETGFVMSDMERRKAAGSSPAVRLHVGSPDSRVSTCLSSFAHRTPIGSPVRAGCYDKFLQLRVSE